MPLSWNEIKTRALAFSRKWEGETSERAEAQSLWNDFFGVFGIERRRVAIFEKQVKLVRAGEHLKRGRIDAFWKGMLLIEHKSADQDLDRAFAQAADYFEGLAERDLPRYIIVSDFARFRLYDLEGDTEVKFKLADLHKKVKHFGFIAGYAPQEIKPQDPVNIHAAEQMGRLHDQLKAVGYLGHPLELFLVRLVFCLFADDTGIFPKQSFRDWLDARTAEDGSDLGPKLAELFQILNTHRDKRQKNLDEQINAFDYINGRLFEEALPLAQFDAKMRATLLDCCALNWGSVSPAIFGALFQAVMDEKARRNLGAHYTSEENILKVIKPLFLDELWAEFNRIKGNKNRLFEFHKKLRTLTFLDPACGCGNFLVITYRELRLLELAILHVLYDSGRQQELNVHHLIRLDVDQFYGIEIEEFPAQIAQVALWLIDHQMNVRVSEEFGMYFARIPLVTSPHIVNGNALRLDWAEVLPPERCSYVLGNPPFVGKQYQDAEQKVDLEMVTAGLKGAGLLDFVAAWYVKAASYIRGTQIRCAFVSTNSITQGEQVGVLWGWLLAQGSKIHFAHRTFQWSNEARGMAAVHCVIIGFAAFDTVRKTIYEYDDVRSEPHALQAVNINPYLVAATDVALESRRTPICNVPTILFGSMPNDGGHLLMSDDEMHALLRAEPESKNWIRPFVGAEEFINSTARWCLWLADCPPQTLRAMPKIAKRVADVKAHRLASTRPTTRALAATPSLFGENRQPSSEYLLIPSVSSERREYIPIGFLSSYTIASNLVLMVPDAKLFHFGVLCSTMHNAWVRSVAGRLKSDCRYSNQIVYNNYPWPEAPGKTQKQKIEAAAQGVLDARAVFPGASLADLYDPLTMPPAVVNGHHRLDAAVDAAYGKKSFRNDAERVAFLFELYRKYTSLLPAGWISATKRRAGKKRSA